MKTTRLRRRSLWLGVYAAAAGLACGTASAADAAQTQAPPGDAQAALHAPLLLPSRAPLFDNRLSYTPSSASLLPKHAWAAALALSAVNTWADMPGYFFDGEFTRLSFLARYAVVAGTELTAELGLMGRTGGFMDAPIEGFHRGLGITQARRDAYARNVLHVATRTGGQPGTQLRRQDAGVGFVSPVLGAKQALYVVPEGLLLTAALQLKLPLGDVRRQFAVRDTAFLLALQLEQPFGARVRLQLACGSIVTPAPKAVFAVPTSAVQKFFWLGLVVRINARWAWVASYRNQDGAAERGLFFPLNASTHEFTLGCNILPLPDKRLAVSVGIIENTVHDANTPDFGAALAVSWSSLPPSVLRAK